MVYVIIEGYMRGALLILCKPGGEFEVDEFEFLIVLGEELYFGLVRLLFLLGLLLQLLQALVLLQEGLLQHFVFLI